MSTAYSLVEWSSIHSLEKALTLKWNVRMLCVSVSTAVMVLQRAKWTWTDNYSIASWKTHRKISGNRKISQSNDWIIKKTALMSTGMWRLLYDWSKILWIPDFWHTFVHFLTLVFALVVLQKWLKYSRKIGLWNMNFRKVMPESLNKAYSYSLCFHVYDSVTSVSSWKPHAKPLKYNELDLFLVAQWGTYDWWYKHTFYVLPLLLLTSLMPCVFDCFCLFNCFLLFTKAYKI